MKKLIILFVLVPLMIGIYSRKTTDPPEYPCGVLEVKADEILERCPPEIPETIPEPVQEIMILEEPEETEPVFKVYDIGLDYELQKYTYEQCEKNGLEFELVLAVMQVESNFKSDLISRTNDYGLMQINKVNHKWLMKELGVTDFLYPKQNIDCGIYMLKELFDKYSDEHKVLMAYNFGEAGMKRNWKKGVRSSKYSQKVLQTRERLVGGVSE